MRRAGPLTDAAFLRLVAAVSIGFAFFHFVSALVSTAAHALGWLELTVDVGRRSIGLSPVLVGGLVLLVVVAVGALLPRRA